MILTRQKTTTDVLINKQNHLLTADASSLYTQNEYAPQSIYRQPTFLPTNKKEMIALGWAEADILLIQGDAYIDHPAQGPALLGRWLVAHGFRVALISQPRWRNADEAKEDISQVGRPRLFAALSAGSMDSMLAHYTAFRKLRRDDALTAGGKSGARPNRASLVYTTLVRSAFPGLPIFIGGVEASLRRLSHYDFWQDKLRRSFLLESKADLLIYGPGERPLLEAAQRLKLADEAANCEDPINSLTERDTSDSKAVRWSNAPSGLSPLLDNILGTLIARSPENSNLSSDALILPSHEEIENKPALLMEASLSAEKILHQGGPAAFQKSAQRWVLMQAPAEPLKTLELDFIYGLPFTRRAHPSYKEKIPALEMLATSISTHRGCGGGCSFCSIALHQGRRIYSRSEKSITKEAASLVDMAQKNRKNSKLKEISISDVGAATANFWGAHCLADQGPESNARPLPACERKSCLYPKICPQLFAKQNQWLNLLKKIQKINGIKQVRVASGLRYDLALTDKKALKEFLENFIGGQLKIAPEHLDDDILRLMRKPSAKTFDDFIKFFDKINSGKYFLIPYLISAFPASNINKMKSVRKWFQQRNWRPRQVQAFIPTPGTVATAMYYASVDESGLAVYVPKSDKERLDQHTFLAPNKA